MVVLKRLLIFIALVVIIVLLLHELYGGVEPDATYGDIWRMFMW